MEPERDPPGHLRIGELSRRVGVSPELLRAWERRYQLLSPSRTTGGFRLYDEADERRILRMSDHLRAGLSAAQAARLALGESAAGTRDAPEAGSTPGAASDRLRQSLDEFDEAGAHAELDRLLSSFALETVLRDAVLPYLHEQGERWQRGEASIAQEHFASAVLRGRLLGLARGWGSGSGPLGLLACAPGDQHDLGLICFGLALRGQGWRLAFLGADTPFATLAETARRLRPSLIVLTATGTDRLANSELALVEIARAAPLALAGGGACSSIAQAVGARYLEGDPVTAAARVAGGTP